MSNAVFPSLPGLDWDVIKTPIFSTDVQTSVSGRETRNANWLYPKYKWQLTYNFLRAGAQQELQTIIGFYNARQGQFDPFLFSDTFTPDNAVTGQEIATGDGATTVFQLVRTLGGFIEPVTAPNTVSNIYLNSAVTTAYTVDPTTGLITFTTAPAAGAVITADFSYYWRVRFLADSYDFDYFLYQLWSLSQLEFQSVF
jgi:uncharacterized protein (TIGR02217 family)